MADTRRIRFTETRVVKGDGQIFEEGVEYDLPPRSADRWVRRNVAVYVEGTAAAVPEGEAPPAEIIDGDRKDMTFTAPLEAVHRGFGKYDVIDADGQKVNDKPLAKAEAEVLAEAGIEGLKAAE